MQLPLVKLQRNALNAHHFARFVLRDKDIRPWGYYQCPLGYLNQGRILAIRAICGLNFRPSAVCLLAAHGEKLNGAFPVTPIAIFPLL
ncbi:MAG: hypothetical protein HXK16_09480 [Alloprevotella sp.]|nr:hypothetical protein [Alloprevotella sp.]